MYKSIYYDKKEETVHIMDDEKGYICQKFKNYAFRKSYRGKYKTMHGETVEKTEFIPFQPDPSLYEQDLSIETKILIELYQDSDEVAKNHSIVIIDIETDSTGGFPNVETADKYITAISLYDKLTNRYISLLLDKESQIESTDLIKVYNTEENLLEGFLNTWETLHPDIVSGWNILEFDIPYLVRRIEVVLGKKATTRLSPIGVCYYNQRQQRMVIGCVSSLDYIELYKKFRFEPRPTYNLDYIGKLEVNQGKVKYTGSLNQLYKEDIKKFIEYNICDVEIVKKLDDKFKFIDLAIGICHTGHVPYEWFKMSSRFIEGAIVTYMRRNGNMVAPNKPILEKDDTEIDADIIDVVDSDNNEDTFIGAYVKEPIPGLYDWVISLDINSLYPSCIRTINISPETYIGQVTNWNVEDYVTGKLTEINIGDTKYTLEEFDNLLKTDNVSIGCNGAMYTTKVKGIIPSILDVWFARRVEYKNLAKKCKNEGDLDNANYYDRIQHIQKIFLNSVYGILGLQSGRFYSKPNAEAVTVSGQHIIKTTEKIAISYFNDKFKKYGKSSIDCNKVIAYIDTDSIYTSLLPLMELEEIKEENRKEYAVNVAKELANKINTLYKVLSKSFFNVDDNKIKIIGENVCKTGFWIAKKRYALYVAYELDSDKSVDKFKIKGLDVVRSSFPVKFGKFLDEALKMILLKKDKEEINNKIMEFENKLKSFDVIDIAKNTSVKLYGNDNKNNKVINFNPRGREAFRNVKGTTAQAKAALYYNDFLKKFKLEKKVEAIFSGNKIKWVYLIKNPYNIDCLAFKADGTDPKEIVNIINMYVDRKTVYEKELKNKLQDFYNILKWEFPSKTKQLANSFFEVE